jgi:hypothetical protein
MEQEGQDEQASGPRGASDTRAPSGHAHLLLAQRRQLIHVDFAPGHPDRLACCEALLTSADDARGAKARSAQTSEVLELMSG